MAIRRGKNYKLSKQRKELELYVVGQISLRHYKET